MKIKYLFFILALLILLPWCILFILIEESSPYIFYGTEEFKVFSGNSDHTIFFIAEGLTVVTLIFLFFFYMRVIKPFDTIANGANMLREQDWNTHLRPVGQPDTDLIVNLFNDLLDRLSLERVGNEEQSRMFEEFMANTPVGVIMADSDGNVMMANQASEEFVGDSKKLLGKPISEIGGKIGSCLASLRRTGIETIQLNGGVSARCLRRGFYHLGMPCDFYIIENVTETIIDAERRGYEKVIRIMAHEVNNVVAGMTSVLDTLASVCDDKEFSSHLTQCSHSALNLSRFIGRYADVVRLPQAVVRQTDIVSFISSRMTLLCSLARTSGITIKFEPECCEYSTQIDPVLFELVLINIVKNSVESILSSPLPPDGGSVTIRLSGCADNSKGALITVTDNGPGLSPGASIFTPFFTDKPGGHGLGLMVVREVLRSHRFRFDLSSALGLTTFTIWLKPQDESNNAEH